MSARDLRHNQLTLLCITGMLQKFVHTEYRQDLLETRETLLFCLQEEDVSLICPIMPLTRIVCLVDNMSMTGLCPMIGQPS